MAETFAIDVSTKFHRLMWHISNQLLFLGCVPRASSEENEMRQTPFKQAYNNTNKHISLLAPQLLLNTMSEVEKPQPLIGVVSDNREEPSDDEISGEVIEM